MNARNDETYKLFESIRLAESRNIFNIHVANEMTCKRVGSSLDAQFCFPFFFFLVLLLILVVVVVAGLSFPFLIRNVLRLHETKLIFGK